jgi:hypothetical protein
MVRRYALVFSVIAASAMAQATRRFDGTWSVNLQCEDAGDGALGYTFNFYVTVRDGRLQGEHGAPGTSGYLLLQGVIDPDGHSILTAEGLTGTPEYAVRRVRRGTPYAYHLNTRFDGSSGTGTRIELRRCTANFRRQ